MTHYTDFNYHHNTYEAVGLSWDEVTDILGHEYQETAKDDEKLINWILEHSGYTRDLFGGGAIDEDGWYLFIQPED